MRRAVAPLPLLSALVGACASDPVAAPPTPDASAALDARADAPADAPADADPAVSRGLAVYRRYCASCHGARGLGSGDGPDLRVEVPASTDEEIRRALREGGRRMPVVPIDDAQRADVFAYLRATFGAHREP